MNLSVSNHALSFEDEIIAEKLFKPMIRGHSSTTSGTGLGLAIVKEICDTLHFSCEIQYKNDIFTITISIPIKGREI